eukprot:371179-Pyramimonas_sp.AAC.1
MATEKVCAMRWGGGAGAGSATDTFSRRPATSWFAQFGIIRRDLYSGTCTVMFRCKALCNSTTNDACACLALIGGAFGGTESAI